MSDKLDHDEITIKQLGAMRIHLIEKINKTGIISEETDQKVLLERVNDLTNLTVVTNQILNHFIIQVSDDLSSMTLGFRGLFEELVETKVVDRAKTKERAGKLAEQFSKLAGEALGLSHQDVSQSTPDDTE